MSADYSHELAELMIFTGKAALAIRAVGRGIHGPPDGKSARADVQWLSDFLHNFEGIGRAALDGDHKQLAFMAGLIRRGYAQHLVADPSTPDSPGGTVARHERTVDLRSAIATLSRLEAKAKAADLY